MRCKTESRGAWLLVSLTEREGSFLEKKKPYEIAKTKILSRRIAQTQVTKFTSDAKIGVLEALFI